MRLTWLWVLLYGVILGLVLFFLGLSLGLGFAFSLMGGITGDIGGFPASWLSLPRWAALWLLSSGRYSL